VITGTWTTKMTTVILSMPPRTLDAVNDQRVLLGRMVEFDRRRQNVHQMVGRCRLLVSKPVFKALVTITS